MLSITGVFRMAAYFVSKRMRELGMRIALGSAPEGPASDMSQTDGCNPEGAEIPFDNILDRVTGSDPSVTDYVLERAAKRECMSVIHSLQKTDRRCDFCEFSTLF